LGTVTDDIETLRAERDALLERDVQAWLVWARDEAPAYRQFETSISWRITKPIRWAGTFVRKVRSDGFGAAVGLAFTVVSQRVSRR
jgi:hypothetical protein